MTVHPQYSFGAGQLFAALPGANTPIRFGAVQGVSLSISFAQKMVYGRKQFPIGIYRGVAKLTGVAEFAHINGAIFEKLFFGAGAAKTVGVQRLVQQEAHTVTANIVTANHAAGFFKDLGVTRVDNGQVFERTIENGLDGPIGQQYFCNETTGVYTFNYDPDSNCNTNDVLINYLWTDTASGSNLAIANQDQGIAPSFKMVLTETFNGKSMTVVLNSCQATKLNMAFKQNDFMIPELGFSYGADANGSVGSISLEGDIPCPFHETFLLGRSGYANISGDVSVFSIVETEYGNGLYMAPSITSAGILAKVIGAYALRKIKVKFKLTTLGTDDSMIMGLVNAPTPAGQPFQFVPRRESVQPFGNLPMIVFNGNQYGLSGSPLAVNEWYELFLDFLPAGGGHSGGTITKISDSSVISVDLGFRAGSAPIATMLTFRADSGYVSSGTIYDEIMVSDQ